MSGVYVFVLLIIEYMCTSIIRIFTLMHAYSHLLCSPPQDSQHTYVLTASAEVSIQGGLTDAQTGNNFEVAQVKQLLRLCIHAWRFNGQNSFDCKVNLAFCIHTITHTYI